MASPEEERIDELIHLIRTDKDVTKLRDYIHELNELIGKKLANRQRLTGEL